MTQGSQNNGNRNGETVLALALIFAGSIALCTQFLPALAANGWYGYPLNNRVYVALPALLTAPAITAPDADKAHERKVNWNIRTNISEYVREARREKREAQSEVDQALRDAKRDIRNARRDARNTLNETERGIREAHRDVREAFRDTHRTLRDAVREARTIVRQTTRTIRSAVRQTTRAIGRSVRHTVRTLTRSHRTKEHNDAPYSHPSRTYSPPSSKFADSPRAS